MENLDKLFFWKNLNLAEMGVNVWTVNSESDMIKMINYGVDGIITDFPNRLKKVCETNNVKWF